MRYEGYCKFCDRQTIAKYNGIQNDENDKPHLHLLTCISCGDTYSVPLDGLEELVEVEDEEDGKSRT